jgi:hypothetical protein
MKKYTLFAVAFLFFFASQNAGAQLVHGENMADIEYRISNDTNLYQRLAERFESPDNDLTTNELSTLYYGYALRPQYDPLAEDRVLKAVYALGRREKYEEATSLLDNFLGKPPACLSALLEQAYLAWMMEDSLATVNGFERYYQMLEIPLTSGDGNSSENAFVVSSERDMELVLDKLGYAITGQSLITKKGRHYYLVTCNTEEDRDMKKQFYFDVDMVVRGRRVRE